MRNLVRDKERKVDGTVLNCVCVYVAVCLLEFTWKELFKFILRFSLTNQLSYNVSFSFKKGSTVLRKKTFSGVLIL